MVLITVHIHNIEHSSKKEKQQIESEGRKQFNIHLLQDENLYGICIKEDWTEKYKNLDSSRLKYL